RRDAGPRREPKPSRGRRPRPEPAEHPRTVGRPPAARRMNVIVIGKGGREHALVWKLAQSPRAGKVFCAPGNAGTARDGVNVPIDPTEFDKLARFCRKERVGLAVIGPEEPL